jgi:hypothetical protein
MKNAVVSLAAVLMVLASFATPSLAAGNSQTYNGQKFSMNVTVPDTVAPGGTLVARGTITINDDGTASRQTVAYRLSAPDLRQSRSGVKDVAVGRTKSVTKSFLIPARITPGDYTIDLYVNVGGEIGVVSAVVHVGTK